MFTARKQINNPVECMTGEDTVSWGRCRKVKDGALSGFFFQHHLAGLSPACCLTGIGQEGTQIYQISINHSS